MARMSLPQMDDAFIRTRTCPWLGSGTGDSRNSTVLLPGKITPAMLADVVLMICSIRLSLTFMSRRGDLAAQVPQVFPALIVLPEKDLALDQPAVLVNRRDLPHLVFSQRLGYDSPQAAQILC